MSDDGDISRGAQLSSVWRISRELFRLRPRPLALSLGCLVASSFAEGLGLLSLVPTIELLIGVDAENMTPISRSVEMFLASIGAPLTAVSVLALFVLSICVKSMLNFAAGLYFGFTVSAVTRDLRLQLIDGLSRARWTYFAGLKTGMIVNSISTEAQEAEVVARQVLSVLSGVIQAVVYVGAALAISTSLTVAAVAAGATMMLLLNGLVRMAREAGGERVSGMRVYATALVDWLANMKPLKAMGLERSGQNRLREQTEALYRAQKRLILANQSITALQEPVTAVAMVFMLLAAIQVFDVGAASLAVMAVLFQRTVARLGAIQNAVKGVVASETAYLGVREAIQRVRENDEAPVKTQPSGGGDASGAAPLLTFDSVRYRYDAAPVLEHLDLEFPSGALTALLGPSGAGKSTCLDLLAGLLRPSSGRVLVDGVDLLDLDMRVWRGAIGYVPQEMALLHDSIRVNLTMGDPRFSDAAVWAALEQAGARDFVESQPDGLECMVGERGQKLSGGQRQRLAIARALLRQPRLLLLDEATSALDVATEQDICDRLVDMLPSMTIIATSHRPAIKAVAQRIYRLEHGVLIGESEPDRRVAQACDPMGRA